MEQLTNEACYEALNSIAPTVIEDLQRLVALGETSYDIEYCLRLKFKKESWIITLIGAAAEHIQQEMANEG